MFFKCFLDNNDISPQKATDLRGVIIVHRLLKKNRPLIAWFPFETGQKLFPFSIFKIKQFENYYQEYFFSNVTSS